MGRKNTKAKKILAGLQVRVEMAAEAVRLTQQTLNQRVFEYETLKSLYGQMQVDLAPQPHQSAARATTNSGMARATRDSLKSSAKKRLSDECVRCSYPEHDQIHHDLMSAEGHPFETRSQPAKKSSTKKRAGLPELNNDSERCTYTFSDSSACEQPADANIHHLATWAHFHPFVSNVQDAAQSLSPNGAGELSTANSEAAAVSAQVAAGGSSE